MANNGSKQIYKGSEWRKWDLQIHCPDDVLNNQFDGKDRDDKWEKYVTRLEQSGLEAVGLTNYFCIEGYEEISSYKSKGRLKNLKLILPNLEFRLSQPNRSGEYINIHIIFSNQINATKIKDFLNRLPIISTDSNRRNLFCSQSDLQKIGYKKALVEFSQFRETLNENFVHRKDYLVAGVSRGHGSFRPEQNEGRGASLAIEIDKICDFFFGNAGDVDHFLDTSRYKDAERKAVVRASDAHDLGKIDSLFTWIKADPTFDGLKQIIYEPKERVVIEENDPSAFRHVIIDSFVVSKRNDDFFLKNIGDVFLNPGLNCVIGPRGAGKSALLDAMSFSLGDRKVLNEERNNYIGYFFQRNDADIIKSNVKSSYLGEVKTLSPDSATTSGFLFDYYHQKQIGYLADPTHEEELSRFIFEKIFKSEADANTLIRELNEQRDQHISQLAINREKVYACEKEILKEEEINNKIRDKNSRVQLLSKKSIKDLLSERNKIIKIEGKLKKIKERIESMEEKPLLKEEDLIDTTFFKEICLSSIDPEGRIVPEAWKSLESRVNTLVQSTHKDKKELEDKITQLTQEIEKLEPSFDFSTKLKKIHQKIENESTKHGLTMTTEDLGRLDSLQSEIGVLEEHAKFVSEKKGEKQTLLKERNRLLSEYNKNLSSVRSKLDESFEELLKGDGAILNNTIRVDVQTNLLLGSYLDTIKSKAKHDSEDSSVPRFPSEKALLGLFNSLGSEKIIASFRNDSFDDWRAPGLGPGGIEYFKKIKNKEEVAMHLEELLPELTAHLLWRPDPTKDFKKLSHCSIGERGTALLSVILVTGDEPLIIDQPEDDLDHFYLYKTLTPIIGEVKKRRQLIFATHDGNIVVNGDAELIIIVTSEDGKFGTVTLTSIENQENRERVMDVLEGGKDAFKKREQKYGEIAK